MIEAFLSPRLNYLVHDSNPNPNRQNQHHSYTKPSEQDKDMDVLMEKISEMKLTLNDDARRIFHGRGGFFPGYEHITLDWMPPVLLLTIFDYKRNSQSEKHGSDIFEKVNDNEEEFDEHSDEVKKICGAIGARWNQLGLGLTDSQTTNTSTKDGQQPIYSHEYYEQMNLVYQRRLLSGKTKTSLLYGKIPPSNHIICENNDKYYVHLLKGQNHGLFLDMLNGRNWLREKLNSRNQNGHIETTKILNLFSYTCAFSVCALNTEKKSEKSENETSCCDNHNSKISVINMDMSKGALKIGQRNHELNSLSGTKARAKFLSHDIFKSWGKIKKLGPYDIIVCDPPSYQKGSFIATKDYPKIIRRIPSLLKGEQNNKSYALICLNAPELDTQYLKDMVKSNAPELKYIRRIENPDNFPAIDNERSLKVLLYEL